MTNLELLEHYTLIADEYGFDDADIADILERQYSKNLADEWLLIRNGLKEPTWKTAHSEPSASTVPTTDT